MRILKVIWASPNTLLGLVGAGLALASRGRCRIVDGVLEVAGGVPAWLLRHATLLPGGVQAMTLGHVVLGRDTQALMRTRIHERVHVAQYERWGAFFLPAYGVASVVARARGGDFYRDNLFERAAFEHERWVREARLAPIEASADGHHGPRQ